MKVVVLVKTVLVSKLFSIKAILQYFKSNFNTINKLLLYTSCKGCGE